MSSFDQRLTKKVGHIRLFLVDPYLYISCISFF